MLDRLHGNVLVIAIDADLEIRSAGSRECQDAKDGFCIGENIKIRTGQSDLTPKRRSKFYQLCGRPSMKTEIIAHRYRAAKHPFSFSAAQAMRRSYRSIACLVPQPLWQVH